jgi:hypothetical protein
VKSRPFQLKYERDYDTSNDMIDIRYNSEVNHTIELNKYNDITQVVTGLLKLVRLVEADSIWVIKAFDGKSGRSQMKTKNEGRAKEILVET